MIEKLGNLYLKYVDPWIVRAGVLLVMAGAIGLVLLGVKTLGWFSLMPVAMFWKDSARVANALKELSEEELPF